MAEGSKGYGDGRINVGAGDVACGEDDDHDGQPRRCGIPQQSDGPPRLLVHDGSGRRRKDQDERADQLRRNLFRS